MWSRHPAPAGYYREIDGIVRWRARRFALAIASRRARPADLRATTLRVPSVSSPAAPALNFRLAGWMMAAMITLILTGLLRGVRTRRALVLENLALRHQLAVLQRTARRPRLRPSDRVFWVLLSRLWGGWAEAVSFVARRRC